MATRKLTVTLPEAQLDAIRSLVGRGRTKSVSGFVQHAVDIALTDAAGWNEMLEEALVKSGGPLTDKERQWAEDVLGIPATRKRPRKHRAA